MNEKVFKSELRTDQLRVVLCKDRAALGNTAASAVSTKIKALLERQRVINMIFAAAPSQNEFLEALVADKSIPWKKINAFRMRLRHLVRFS
jgi:glucosamine-6-phosphate deaminase